MKSLPRLAKTTSQRIVRNPQQAFAAIFVMFLTFFSLAGFILIFAGSNTLLSYFESRPQVTAFFKDDTKVEQIDDLKSSLNETGKISKLKYISKGYSRYTNSLDKYHPHCWSRFSDIFVSNILFYHPDCDWSQYFNS